MRSLLIIFLFLSLFGYSQENVREVWNGKMSTKERVDLVDSLCFQYKYEDESIGDSIGDILLYNSKGNTRALAFSYEADIHSIRSEYVVALEMIDSAILNTKDQYLQAKFHNSKGEILGIMGDQPNAFVSFRKAQLIADELDDDHLRCQVYVSLGEFNRKTSRFETALTYLDSASALVEKNGFEDLLAVSVLDRYAAVYTEAIDINIAKKYSLRALKLAEQINDLHSIAVSHNELGYTYQHTGVKDSAVWHYEQAIAIWEDIGADIYLANALTNIGRFYFREGEIEKCKVYLLQAEDLLRNRKWYNHEIEIYAMLSAIYGSYGDSVGFYKYQSKSYHATLDRTVLHNNKKMVELEHQYAQADNLRIIEAQKKELELDKENIELERKRRDQLWIFLIIVGLLLLVALVLFIRTNLNKRQIASINANLKDALEDKEVLLKEIHHRVKNNLQMVSSLMAIQSRSTSDAVAKQALLEGQSRIHSMAILHQKLYSGDNYSSVIITEYLKDIFVSLSHSDMRTQDVFRINDLPDRVNIEQAIPVGFIIHELATNSLKHAWENQSEKRINVTISLENGELEMIYNDNGRGWPEDLNVDTASSLGMKLIQLFAHRQLKGETKTWNSDGAFFSLKFKLREE